MGIHPVSECYTALANMSTCQHAVEKGVPMQLGGVFVIQIFMNEPRSTQRTACCMRVENATHRTVVQQGVGQGGKEAHLATSDGATILE